MGLSSGAQQKIMAVLDAKTGDITESLAAAGLNPCTGVLCDMSFRRVQFREADIAGWDLSGTDLSGGDMRFVKNINLALFNEETVFDDVQLPEGITPKSLLRE